MKLPLSCAAILLALASLPIVTLAKTPAGTASLAPAKHERRHKPSLQEQLLDLQQQMAAQNAKLQGEIDSLRTALAAKQSDTSAAMQTAQAAQENAAAAQEHADASAQQNMVALNQLRDTITATNEGTNATIAQVQKRQTEISTEVESPAAIHYKGVMLTPGGFLAGESIWRQRAMNADIYTNFNSTPYPSNGNAHTSEWVPTARGSRLSMLASGKVPFGVVRGLFEGDFLSAGITSNNLQSNSYTLRVRQAWGEANTGQFVFTGGQMWTLLTESRRAAQPGEEQLPLIFDGNIHVGVTYTRQLGFRLQDTIAPGVTAAIALENSQYQFSATNAASNFFVGNAGAAGGLNNPTANYTNQVSPDVLVKVSFDPGYGHYEIGGVARFFRARYYPNETASAGAQNDTVVGGGFVANARFPVTPLADLGLHLVAGDGTGRYGASLLPDITVKPNGTLEPLRNLQAMFSLELHPTKNLDIFSYLGTEYVQRTYYANASGVLVGYAPPTGSNAGCFTEAVPTAGTGFAPGTGSCLGATRDIIQGSLGYVYRIYAGPAGRLQYGLAYSYLTRSAWSGVGGAPKATNNFVYTSFRYFLP